MEVSCLSFRNLNLRPSILRLKYTAKMINNIIPAYANTREMKSHLSINSPELANKNATDTARSINAIRKDFLGSIEILSMRKDIPKPKTNRTNPPTRNMPAGGVCVNFSTTPIMKILDDMIPIIKVCFLIVD